MKTYEHAGPALLTTPRSHPWSSGTADAQARYYDFTTSPQLIRTVLEDFKALEHYPAIEEFYSLLERINHPRSLLESNDCALSAPDVNQTVQVKAKLECTGRVMLLYRDLVQNTRTTRLSWLKMAFHYQLAQLDPKFSLGMIGTTLVPVRYLALPEGGQLGEQLMLSFWAFGATEQDTMLNLGRLFKNLTQAMRAVSARIVQGD
jgi:hypothetical protein